MIKSLGYIITLFIGVASFSQVTILVEELPENTDKEATIYISGDFENWSGGQEFYKLSQVNDAYVITLPKQDGPINFKLTQGSWNSVECDAKGNAIDNRTYRFQETKDTLRLTVEGWMHLVDSQPKSTAAENVSLLSEAFYIPQLDRNRKVWVYLPPDYNTSKESYPVVYMHDGQNLFDALTSYSGEWSVDETLNQLFEERHLKLIVVGIENGGSKRLDEYSPWKNEAYGGGEGEAYVDFLVQNLKPYVDSHFRTLTSKANTAIIGSSMGGLISHYAGLKYPKVFGKVGVFSPAFWFAPSILDYTKQHGAAKDTKMYFLAGGKEGEEVAFQEISQTVKDMESIVSILKNQGFPSEHIQSKVEPEGKHNEQLWRMNFEEAICWLFSEKIEQREFVKATASGNNLNVEVSDGKYRIVFYNSNIVETTFIPKGESFQSKSHAVVLEPKQQDVTFSESDKVLQFSNKDFEVRIQKKPFQISYWYQDEEVIHERNGYQKNNTFETIQFGITNSEVLYGAGARALGMNRRGNRLELYNKAHYGYETHSKLMNFTLPIVLSSKQYLLHFDNAPIGFLDLDSQQNNTLTYETISGRKTYQVVVGDSWEHLIDDYTHLTGKQPMLPRWALGNFSSRFGYHSQKEVLETISKFKEEEIPVDAIILDLYWFGKEVTGTMGNLAFDKDSFPNPQQMIKTLRDQDVETILITEPFVLTTSNRWQQAVSQKALATDSLGKPATYDFFFGNTGLIDVYSNSGYHWFKGIYKDLLNLGVTGFWGDLGEPELHPSWVQHTTGTANEVHNIYGHDWARLVNDAFKDVHAKQRPFILMRAGYSGSQRFGMVPWSGDVNRTWGGLQSQPEIALQMGMQGIGYMHSDLGGFAGVNLDDELYVRWLQYGVFQPIFRPHAQEEVASEPVFRSDKAKNLAKQAIELRYQLLPYNYSLVFQNHRFGTPLMRPLFFEEPDNLDLLHVANSYFWGNDFLITPVLKSDEKIKEVYFPKSSNWFNFYTDEKFEGETKQEITVSEEYIPTFVRGGSLIPMTKPIQSTKEFEGNALVLHYYLDESVKTSHHEIYQDDGQTIQAFENGQFELLKIDVGQNEDAIQLEMKAQIGGNYSTSEKEITFVIHNIQTTPKRIKIDQKKSAYQWDDKQHTVTMKTSWNTAKNQNIELKLNY